MRLASIIAATALVALIPLAASAGEVENRIHNQNARIDQGIRNGSLTYREDRGVDHRLNNIQAQRNRDLRHDGGHLTTGQYAHLNHEENNLSNRIYFDKHNAAHQQ
jgi:hypothetical protein